MIDDVIDSHALDSLVSESDDNIANIRNGTTIILILVRTAVDTFGSAYADSTRLGRDMP